MTKKVKFAENMQQWIPIKQSGVVLDQVNNVPDKESQKTDYHGKDVTQSTEQKVYEKKLKRQSKELGEKEKVSASSRKAAKVRTEWQV